MVRPPSQRTIDAGPALPLRLLAADADAGQNNGRRTLNAIQRRRERLAVATEQVDVVACHLRRVEADGLADDEGHGLRFKLACVS